MKHIKKIVIIMMAGTILCSGQPVTVHATAVTSENGQAAASDDNSLSSLSLSEGQISPALQAGVTKYTATVPNDVTEVEVSARTTNAKASITSISGNTNLSEGENLISIVVTAENGSAATYKITVTRETANAAGVAGALVAAQLALAGIRSPIPADEAILAMKRVGDAMPTALKETAEGGLAATPAGKRLYEQVFGKNEEGDASPACPQGCSACRM